MEKTLKNRLLDQLFYHKYDWKVVRGYDFYSFTQKVTELKGVQHGYEVYKPVGNNLYPMKVVLYRKKGYKPEMHWSVKLEASLSQSVKEKLKGVSVENVHPYQLMSLVCADFTISTDIYKHLKK